MRWSPPCPRSNSNISNSNGVDESRRRRHEEVPDLSPPPMPQTLHLLLLLGCSGPAHRERRRSTPSRPSSKVRVRVLYRPRSLHRLRLVSHCFSLIAAEPRFLVANHNYRERPVQLYWFDVDAMQKLVQRNDALLVTAYNDNNNQESGQDDSDFESLLRPVRPTLTSLQEFKVSPAIHAAYAFTWFSLSLAGLIMTRRLASASAFAAASPTARDKVSPSAAAAAAASTRGR
jgi:SURF1 family